MTKALELTVTQKLRLFLARSGQAVAPWSSVDEVMDRLYGLLYRRREQAGLWEDLAALLDSIQTDARGVLAAPDAEILSKSRVDDVVDELRRAMRASVETPATGAMQRFSIGKSASVLACIALLAAGFSLGCGSSSPSAADASRVADSAPSVTPDTAPSVAQDVAPSPTADTAPSVTPDTAPSPTPDTAPASADLAPISVPDAGTTKDGPPVSATGDAAKDQGRDSSPQDAALTEAGDASASPADATDDGSSDATSGDSLMDLFRDGTPDQIADRLEASVDSRPDAPIIGPAYKGVTFPPEKAV